MRQQNFTRPRPIVRYALVAAALSVTSLSALANDDALAPGSTYVIQLGDTISTIAARVEGRETGNDKWMR